MSTPPSGDADAAAGVGPEVLMDYDSYVDEKRIPSEPVHSVRVSGEVVALGLYDFPGDDEPYPFRRLTRWFLAREGKPDLRLPLQADCDFIVLYGMLEPSPAAIEAAKKEGKTPPGMIKIRLDQTRPWTIDNGHTQRGIWFETDGAWYKLIEPSNVAVPQPDGSVVSQEDVHAKMRAKFGLVSNLYDMLHDRDSGARNQHDDDEKFANQILAVHADRTPKESHGLLAPSKEQLKINPQLNRDPFDYELLRREAEFVYSHLKDFHKSLTMKSRFLKGVTRMKSDFGSARKKGVAWAVEDLGREWYEASAKKSEKRSRRMPWGDMQPGHSYPGINESIRMKVGAAKKKMEAQDVAEEEVASPGGECVDGVNHDVEDSGGEGGFGINAEVSDDPARDPSSAEVVVLDDLTDAKGSVDDYDEDDDQPLISLRSSSKKKSDKAKSKKNKGAKEAKKKAQRSERVKPKKNKDGKKVASFKSKKKEVVKDIASSVAMPITPMEFEGGTLGTPPIRPQQKGRAGKRSSPTDIFDDHSSPIEEELNLGVDASGADEARSRPKRLGHAGKPKPPAGRQKKKARDEALKERAAKKKRKKSTLSGRGSDDDADYSPNEGFSPDNDGEDGSWSDEGSQDEPARKRKAGRSKSRRCRAVSANVVGRLASASASDHYRRCGKNDTDEVSAGGRGQKRKQYSLRELTLKDTPRDVDFMLEFNITNSRRHLGRYIFVPKTGKSQAVVRNDMLLDFLQDIVRAESVQSYETMHVALEAILNSSERAVRSLFIEPPEKENTESGCRSIFVTWLGKVKCRMLERRKTRPAVLKDLKKSKLQMTEEVIAAQIMRLIKVCCGPRSVGQMVPGDVLRLFDVDFDLIVDGMTEFAHANMVDVLKFPCKAAKIHLSGIRKMVRNAGGPSSGNEPDAVPRRTRQSLIANICPPPSRHVVPLCTSARAPSSAAAARGTRVNDALGNAMQQRRSYSTKNLTRDCDQKKAVRQQAMREKTERMDLEERLQKAKQKNKSLRRALESATETERIPKRPKRLGRSALVLSGVAKSRRDTNGFSLNNTLLALQRQQAREDGDISLLSYETPSLQPQSPPPADPIVFTDDEQPEAAKTDVAGEGGDSWGQQATPSRPEQRSRSSSIGRPASSGGTPNGGGGCASSAPRTPGGWDRLSSIESQSPGWNRSSASNRGGWGSSGAATEMATASSSSTAGYQAQKPSSRARNDV